MRDAALEAIVAMKLQQTAEVVCAAAKAICPVDTGELQASIHVDNLTAESVDVVADADYALAVELGTHKQSPQPFLRPALDIARGTIQAIWSGS